MLMRKPNHCSGIVWPQLRRFETQAFLGKKRKEL
jgi:hypothetical protein